ncbi:MAG: hypothetical protein CFH22_00520 [Alphaproteobacteria bacterium MarineAlpha5_Bin12]|nr:MAG: hypothetical protein CFH22_00520 [Alphaproteobacteria bacterium MarineAlpha5_Bin12]|tara:strand:+ start:2834 stop:4012 length:1179 start_codon:yes stop_codon:yes gene_type:complete
MKKLILNLLILLSAPFCLLLYFLKPIITIRFGIMQSSRIGGLAIMPEIYLNEKKKLSLYKPFNFDIISFENSICNEQLASLVSRKINIFPYSKILYFIIKCITFWLPKNSNVIKFISHPTQNFFLNNNNILKFNQIETTKALKLLKEIGINNNDKWICIHNRDPSYLNHHSKRDWSYHNYRDFSILSMKETCNYFLSKNYYVIRLGKNAQDKLYIDHPKLIDYPFLKIQNDLLELYLMANSTFFIGSSSGPSMVPFVFRRPILLTNYTEPVLLNKLKHNNYLILLKLFFDTKKNRILKISEIFDRKLENIYQTSMFENSNIKLLENSSDEILNASIELEKFIQLQQKENYFNNNLQNKFWNIIDKYSEKNPYKYHNLFISPYFLKKYESIIF